MGVKQTKVEFRIREEAEFSIVNLELKDNVTPDVLKELTPPKVDGRKGVILSGRAPIWLYCFLVHFYHTTKFVATFDPRIGAIVVESHHPDYKVGEVIEVRIDEQ